MDRLNTSRSYLVELELTWDVVVGGNGQVSGWGLGMDPVGLKLFDT